MSYWAIEWKGNVAIVFNTMEAIRLINEREGCTVRYVSIGLSKVNISH